MSEPIVGCCSVCGASGGGGHHPDCWLGDIQTPQPPAVYDLAEFERQLVAQMYNSNHGEYAAVTYGALLQALRSSKREAK